MTRTTPDPSGHGEEALPPSKTLEAIEAFEQDALLGSSTTAADGADERTLDQGEGLSLDRSRLPATRRQVLAWSLWDWGSAAFNAVVTTFVFTRWLNSEAFVETAITDAATAEAANGIVGGPAAAALANALAVNSSWLGWGLGIAGLLVGLLAPVLANRADRAGHRKLWLGVHTGFVVLLMAAMALVTPDQDALTQNLLLGVGLLAASTLFFEFASVSYNAMLRQISTPRSVGRISGIGWGLGYVGGIALLLLLLYGFIDTDNWLGLTGENGMDIRMAVLASAVWFAVFALPVMFMVPEHEANPRRGYAPGEKPTASLAKRIGYAVAGFFESYPKLWRDIRRIQQDAPGTIYFLFASTVFRDGLNGVFTFGAVIGGVTFGLDASETILFAVAANIVAGIVTIVSGWLDDLLGPKVLIIVSLLGLLAAASVLFVLHDGGKGVFWIWGLVLSAFVGPAQSASRSFLARATPRNREGEVFGLYATTGRIASFMSPMAFAGAIGLSSVFLGTAQQYWGILGIGMVLLAGLLLVLPAKLNRPVR